MDSESEAEVKKLVKDTELEGGDEEAAPAEEPAAGEEAAEGGGGGEESPSVQEMQEGEY